MVWVVGKMALEQLFSEYVGLYPARVILPMLHIVIYLLSTLYNAAKSTRFPLRYLK